MLASAFLFSLHLAVLKLASLTFHPFQIAFLRNLLGALVLGGWLLLTFKPASVRSVPLFAIRSVLGVAAGLALYFANANAPLASVALIFHARIFLLVALAGLALHERVSPTRWAAITIGFAGIALAISPTEAAGWSVGLLAALAAAVLSAGSQVAVKALTRDNPPLTIAAFSLLAFTVLSAPMAIPVWIAPTLPNLALILLASIFSALAALSAAKAFALAQASVVSPMDNSGIVLSAALGFMVFGEIPGWSVVAGAVLVLAAAFYVAQRT